MNKTDLQTLCAQRQQMIAQMPAWTEIVRGSLMRYGTRCGYRGCRCHRGPAFRHGPYWYVVVHQGKGKQKLYAVPKDQLRQVRKGKRAYERLWRALMKVSEINLRILKAQTKAVV